jgi:type II secretory pathway pseudopilin PulG
MLTVSGMKPGASVTCECGNVMAVPKAGTPWLIILLGMGGLAVMCTGILAAIAIPNFMRFQSRAKQAECRTYLRSFYVGQLSASGEAGGYPRELAKAQFAPERGNRYAYFVEAGPMEDRSGPQAQGVEEARAIGVDTFQYKDAQPITFAQLPPQVAQQAGLSGECPDCRITLVCAGNIDRDDTLDVWSISTGERTVEGKSVPAGEPLHHVDDVKD